MNSRILHLSTLKRNLLLTITATLCIVTVGLITLRNIANSKNEDLVNRVYEQEYIYNELTSSNQYLFITRYKKEKSRFLISANTNLNIHNSVAATELFETCSEPATDDLYEKASSGCLSLCASDTIEIMESKSAYIKQKFNMICKQGRWLPASGAATSMVFITTGSLPNGRIDEEFYVRFEAIGGVPPYKWKIECQKLPSELSFDELNGSLRGIPTNCFVGECLVSVQDTAGHQDIAKYKIIIEPKVPLQIVNEVLPPIVPGISFYLQLIGTGGFPPYVWSATVNATDEDIQLFLNETEGVIYGCVASNACERTIPLHISLRDSQGMEINKPLFLHIKRGPLITTMPTNIIYQDRFFSFDFEATGGDQPYKWELSGELPTGLRFFENGVLEGTPETHGNYEIRITVYDQNMLSDSIDLSLKILPLAPERISNFHALLSRSRVALMWDELPSSKFFKVHIVRNTQRTPLTPFDGSIVYSGSDNFFIDKTVGTGTYYYAAFLAIDSIIPSNIPPSTLKVKLPPQVEPFADAIVSISLLHSNAFGLNLLPSIVLGPPHGTGLGIGSADVLSLGAAVNNDNGRSSPYGGTIILEFKDNLVWDGPGYDFTIFENVFYIYGPNGELDPHSRFMEPAIVAVSQDGISWKRFKTDFSPRLDPRTGKLNLHHPFCYSKGFAGVNPVISNGLNPDPTDPEVSGGDSFDLAETGLKWVKYIQITATGSGWMTDDDGDTIYHLEDCRAADRTFNRSGFDLDAVAGIWIEKIVSNETQN